MKKKTSSPVDFKNLDTETLINYAEFYTDKLLDGDVTMWNYYHNMMTLATDEIERRSKRYFKKWNKTC